MKKIWIFMEQNHGTIHMSFFELLAKSRELYPQGEITAIAFGPEQPNMEKLKKCGADIVLWSSHDKLTSYHPAYFSFALTKLAEQYLPDILLIAATPIGSELAPSVAAKLKTGLAAHCIDLCTDETGGLIALIPAFGGKLMGEIIIPKTRPAMATVKPGTFERTIQVVASDPSLIKAESGFLDTYTSSIELVGIQTEEVEGTAIEDAQIIICAGLGINTTENWEKTKLLAKMLHGSVGYTRPIVDMGYTANESSMIGTSGKLVHPKLYIGFGISGATHHICGMKDSDIIISINTNEKAAIFSVSDYKYIGDCTTVLDELIGALKE